MSEARIWHSKDPDQKLLPGDCQNVIVLSMSSIARSSTIRFRPIWRRPKRCLPARRPSICSCGFRIGVSLLGDGNGFPCLAISDWSASWEARTTLVPVSFGRSLSSGSIWFARCGPNALHRLIRMVRVCLSTGRMQFCPTEGIVPMFNKKPGIWRLPLEQIEATVADHLGRGRVQGNQPGPCFSRQVSMYLAKKRWRLEHDPDWPVLQRSAPHHRNARDCENRTPPQR